MSARTTTNIENTFCSWCSFFNYLFNKFRLCGVIFILIEKIIIFSQRGVSFLHFFTPILSQKILKISVWRVNQINLKNFLTWLGYKDFNFPIFLISTHSKLYQLFLQFLSFSGPPKKGCPSLTWQK